MLAATLPLLVSLSVATASTCAAQEPSAGPSIGEAIDQAIAEEMASNHLPGVAVVVVRNGKTIHKRGYGFADLSAERAIDPDKTLFRIGSVSKALTSFAVTRLVQDERLSLSADVAKLVDGISNEPGFKEPVTTWNLLTHTSGFDQIGGRDRQVREFGLSLAERKALRPNLATYLGGNKLRRVTAPGLYFRYDTFGITAAGRVLESITELPYAKAMQQELFDRVGMKDTFVEVPTDRFADLAVGYGWLGEQYGIAPYEVYATTPASSIDSTPADMGRLLEALTGEGKNAHGRLFTEAMNAEVLAPQFRPHPRFSGATHGLWESHSLGGTGGRGVRSVGHGGTNLGFWTMFTIIPEHGLGVLVVANRDPEAGGGRVTAGNRVLDIVADEFIGDVPPRSTAAATPDREIDLAPYAGDYYRGIYCHSCSDEELRNGAWPRGRSLPVLVEGNALRMEDALYLPTTEDDVFVREDGLDEMFFGRDTEGRICFRVSAEGPVTREHPYD